MLAVVLFPLWMAGSWRGTVDGVSMEEHWTNADGHLMVGMHRDVRANGKASFEFMRIETSKDGTLVYQAMPSGRPATPFTLKESSAQRVVFENAAHDFPQRIIYWREGEKLCARTEGTINGKPEQEQWCWARADSPR
jgi:Domain of unknown function (DUF6265)